MSEGLKMKNVSLKYIELACKKTGLSQRQIGKEIGVTAQQISNLKLERIDKHGKNISTPELKDESLLRLAQFAQVSPMKIIAEKHKRIAKGTAERKFWDALSRSKEVLEETKQYILCSIQNDIKIY